MFKISLSNKSKYIEVIGLVAILLLAALVRTHKLDSAPYGTLVDEASYGYIANSIAQTGRDELGNFLPISFKAFGDYKLPVYGYLLVPVVKLLGVSNLSVRLPSAISGIFITLLTYLILKKLKFSLHTSFFGALITALSPWTIMLSRFAFESNVALLFFLLSIYFCTHYIHSRKTLFIVLSSIFLGLTWYTYIAYRLITTGILFVSVLHFYTSRVFTRREIATFVAVFVIVILPLTPSIFSQSGTARFSQIGFFSNDATIHEINEFRGLCYKNWTENMCDIVFNRPVAWFGFIFHNLFSSLSVDYLFLNGEKGLLYISVPNYGNFLHPIIFFYFLGIHALFTRFKNTKEALFFSALLLFSLIPSSLVGPPQRIRLSALFPLILFLLVLGYEKLMQFLSKKRVVLGGIVTFFSLSLILILGLIFSLNLVYVHFEKFTLEYAGPLRGAIMQLKKEYPNTDTYFASDLHDAIIHYAFYTNVNPLDYQKYAVYSKPDDGNFSHPIRYKNVYMQSTSLNDIYCLQKKKGTDFVMVTPNNLEQSGDSFEPPVFRFLSHDKNSSLMNIYLFDHKKEIKCSES